VEKTVAFEVQEMAKAAHRVLRLDGYSRSDFILTDQGPVILETNTIPGMTQTSLLPQAAAQAGMSFADLVERLIELAIELRTV
jgi:D-alanine-D-alanine ligase